MMLEERVPALADRRLLVGQIEPGPPESASLAKYAPAHHRSARRQAGP
jgi:hypothetical protein